MDQVCLVVPVADDKSEDARSFMAELDDVRKAEYDASERRLGISKEVWFLAPLPTGAALVAYMESDDFNSALGRFVESRDAQTASAYFANDVAAIGVRDYTVPLVPAMKQSVEVEASQGCR